MIDEHSNMETQSLDYPMMDQWKYMLVSQKPKVLQASTLPLYSCLSQQK